VSESLIGLQLPSPDLDEGRHAGGIDSEAVSDEIIVGPELTQTQSDPIGARQVIEVGRVHSFRLAENVVGVLSTGY
jgi:hypothetical protein